MKEDGEWQVYFVTDLDAIAYCGEAGGVITDSYHYLPTLRCWVWEPPYSGAGYAGYNSHICEYLIANYPNGSPAPIATCRGCDEKIYDGDTYYEVEGETTLCSDCGCTYLHVRYE